MQSGFQASTLWLNGLLVNSSLHGCYSNLSIGTISWHLNGLYFPDIQRGGQWHRLMRRLGDIKWLSFQLYHIGPTFGHFEHGLLSVLEGRGARWRWGQRGGEGADRPGRAERKAEEQLKHGGPCGPFVLLHLCAAVWGVKPKARHLYCAPRARARQQGSPSCLRHGSLPLCRGIIAWQRK